ncbi:hypothetical protein G7062_05485 [Erysipelothrix sp. HDW6C]|uniref:nuclear transport factor 2 family protein n=1 Tax=Erysipelothrix sp. HDW6C TaxID=2714930 RepID=UPI00140D7E03|nr:DUF4440 domain-containing protein [Erysipelothrix sp. HDW6C]QIK69780.1 hypothetical protein G7062_05485 [Erysipelothrix sp. HDW6C]
MIHKLKQYELDFLDFEFISCAENTTQRISEDFIEYAASGAIYNRDIVVNALCTETANRPLSIIDFTVKTLSDDVYMVNYTTIDATNGQHVLRTSIWKQFDSNLKLVFHQGTPTNFI